MVSMAGMQSARSAFRGVLYIFFSSSILSEDEASLVSPAGPSPSWLKFCPLFSPVYISTVHYSLSSSRSDGGFWPWNRSRWI